jgi:hypothetical protein
MVAPDFLSIGHAVKDVVPGGWRLGGAMPHAATQAHRLGLRTAAVTRAADELRVEQQLVGIDIQRIPSFESKF